MDLGALFIGGSLLFIAGATFASVVAVFEVKRITAFNAKLQSEGKSLMGQNAVLKSQLEATRIALREAQKNDHRDALGRFSRAS